MDYQDFEKWLIDTKKMQSRSAKDVKYRLKRVSTLVGTNIIDENTLKALDDSKEFRECTSFVKSQLRRSVILYSEFLG